MAVQAIKTTDDLAVFAQTVLTTVSGEATAAVLALDGPLGAGKTTFVQTVAGQLGVTETVTSPTFVIQRSYETAHERFTTLVHIDAYRLESPDELAALGFTEHLADPACCVCIEWASRVASLLPPHTHFLDIAEDESGVRHVTWT